MSASSLGSKRAVYDIWPLKNKKFFVLADPQNILGETTDNLATIQTISYLLKKKGAVVVASSFGPLSGIPLNLPRKQREDAIEAFHREGGMGYSNYFFNVPSRQKMEILKAVPGYEIPATCSVNCNTGKTQAFCELSIEEKAAALRSVVPKESFAPVSTFPFVEALSNHLPGVNVKFAPDCLRAPIHQLEPGEILVLENLQFYHNETSPDCGERRAMAEVFAADIDVFVNESFVTASKEYASNTALPKILHHGAAGLSMERELAFFSKLLTHPPRPIAVVVAGTHIPEKLLMIRSLMGKVDKILIAGALTMPFVAAKGLSVGKSFNGSEIVKRKFFNSHGGILEEETVSCTQFAEEIIGLCEKYGVELVLPVDHVVTKRLTKANESSAVIVESVAIPSDVYAVDCGANTIALFAKYIRESQCVFWTGTFGWTTLGYNEGTRAFASVLAQERKLSIIGGRSTARFVQQLGLSSAFSHISSGGVSCLEVLQGHLLPGVEALSDVSPLVDSKSTLSVDELLRNLPLFSGCTSHQLNAAARKFVRRSHARGDYLAYQGDRHVSMWVVAQGALVAHAGENTLTIPSRFIGRGQTVGMYDFITQGFAAETVQAASNDTVTYQLTSSSLNDLLNEHPDLAAQFFQNISEPLRIMANEEYHNLCSIPEIVRRAASCSRTPIPYPVPKDWGLMEDIIQDIISTVALQRFTLQYMPYTPIDINCKKEFLWERIISYNGLTHVLCGAVVRDLVYHWFTKLGLIPASLISSIAMSPFRLMAMGTHWSALTYQALLDEALVSAAVSWVPLAAHGSFLFLQRRLERLQRRKCSRVVQILITSMVKVLIGVMVFPIVFRRNREMNRTTLLNVFRGEAFKSYELKQVISLLLRCIVHLLLVMIRRICKYSVKNH
ncbi:phosphoglycerate kinase [Trypanosoma theileri]|uniref:Phosphoglycerate kinase n=1 Tax=Trypanosoma theileri TaxID=67003 RepID=A0A1X0P4C5_9TRYP|nr:phosphoglycerate kinase [Trypanosoma theileri]ORC91772.1 phosphoglycerate kinase [Trypanosoma theileri]